MKSIVLYFNGFHFNKRERERIFEKEARVALLKKGQNFFKRKLNAYLPYWIQEYTKYHTSRKNIYNGNIRMSTLLTGTCWVFSTARTKLIHCWVKQRNILSNAYYALLKVTYSINLNEEI